MGVFDWTVVFLFFVFLVTIMFFASKLNRSIADFVAANRCAGRYIICVSEGAAAVGIMSFLGQFEQYYEGGFCPAFWWLMVTPMYLLITMSGWIIYRFRATRAFTYPQFYEQRYSRKFRIFTGVAGFFALLVLYGICPAILARFLISFAGIPEQFDFLGISISAFPVIIIFALIVPTAITMVGGQITVMISDFVLGQIFQITIILVVCYLIYLVDWSDIVYVYTSTTVQGSFVNPFKVSASNDFSGSFFIMWIIFAIYSFGIAPTTQSFQAAALSPHEAQMSRVWSILRNIITVTLPFFMAIVAYVILHHQKYSELAAKISPVLQNISNESIQSQVRTPVVLTNVLPVGLRGLFLISTLGIAITADSALMQALGTLFTQDIVLPLRGQRFTPKAHMLLLRLAMFGVAIIVFFFSLYFPQTDFLWMFKIQALGIYLAGVGIVTIGGLYWSKGSTAGAWAGMLTGMTVSLGFFVARLISKEFFLNGMQCTCISAIFASIAYVIFSILRPAKYDLNKLFHSEISHQKRGFRFLTKQLLYLPDGFTTRWDKVLGYFVRILCFGMLAIFISITLYNMAIGRLSDNWWFDFWRIYLFFMLFLAFAFSIWLLIGGLFDFRRLVKLLKTKTRDDADDGSVEHDLQ